MKHIIEGYIFIAFIAFFILGDSYHELPDRWEKAFWEASVWPITAMKKLEESD